MKRIVKTVLGLACVIGLLGPVLAGDKKTDAPWEADEMAAMMAEIMKYAMPGEARAGRHTATQAWSRQSHIRQRYTASPCGLPPSPRDER